MYVKHVPFLLQVLYSRTGRLAALTVSLPWCTGAFALAFWLARMLQPRVHQAHTAKGHYRRVG